MQRITKFLSQVDCVRSLVSWFNPSQQLSSMGSCSLTPPRSGWDGEEDREKEVKLVGWDKNGLITKVKWNIIITVIIIVMKGNITTKKREIKPKKRQVMHNAIAHHPLTDARAAIRPSQPTAPHLYTEHGVLWYGIPLWLVQVSCPGSAPSQLLAHLLAGRAWETEKSLT